MRRDRKSTRLNSSHPSISYAVFCLKKKKKNFNRDEPHLGRDKAKSRAGPRADRIFRARKSRADHSRRAWSWNRDWISNPLRLEQRRKSRSPGEIATRKSELEFSVAAFSLAVVQNSQGK